MKGTPMTETCSTRFAALMVLGSLIALGGQGVSLLSLVTFNDTKADWDARDLPSGTYVYRFTIDGKPLAGTVTLLK